MVRIITIEIFSQSFFEFLVSDIGKKDVQFRILFVLLC